QRAPQVPPAAAACARMAGSAPVTRAPRLYFAIRMWSAPFALANYVMLGWLVGQARARTALAIQIAINLTNIAATSLLVIVLNFGIAGAASAAIVAEIVGSLFGLLLAWRPLRDGLSTIRPILFDRAKL